jgi:adenine C2-methylase RlmN of 23S rRNA A2503 and tRNA A37
MIRSVKIIEMACGQAYVIALPDNSLLEVGDVFLPNENRYGTRPYAYKDFGDVSDKNKRVMTICTMVGCPFNCQFCASRRTWKRVLTTQELIEQVDFLIQVGKHFNRSEDPVESREFHVLYTRMGEPFLNIQNVIESMYILIKRYPHIQIGLSTCGVKKGLLQLLQHNAIIPHIRMQMSVHGTDEIVRSKLLGLSTEKTLMRLKEIGEFAHIFRTINPRKISLNFILLKNITYDFKKLRTMIHPDDVYIRLSPLNSTENASLRGYEGLIQEEDVIAKKPRSSTELASVIASIEQAGYTYAYAPAIDEEIKNKAACGQALETLKASQPLHDHFSLASVR